MWRDNGHNLGALLAVAVAVADAAVRTSTTLAIIVIGAIGLALLACYLLKRRRRD